MKSKELLLSVREMLIGAMQDYPFPASDGGHGDLQVFLHGLPEDQRGTYPFICIRWASGGIDEGMEGRNRRGCSSRNSSTGCGLSCAVTVWWPKSLSCNTRSSLRCRNLTGSGSNIITLPFTLNINMLSRPSRWAAL